MALSHILGRLETLRLISVVSSLLLTIIVFDVIYYGNSREEVKDSYLVLVSTFALQGMLSTALDFSIRIQVMLAAVVFGCSLYLLLVSRGDDEGTLLSYGSALVMLSSVMCPVVVNRWWLPVSESKLKEAEEDLLELWCPNCDVNLHVIAGLGTYLVSDNKANATHEKVSSYHHGDNKLKSCSHSYKGVPLVLIHGYGAGNGYWALNIDGLTKAGFQVHCVELPGLGRSDRPPWVTPSSTADALERLSSSLEAWRKQMGLECFVLLGHSLGTHAASAYAVKHPQRVMHLVLASPVGVGLPPMRMRKHLDPEAVKCAKKAGLDLDTIALEGNEETAHGENTKLLKSPAAEVQATMSKPLHQQPLSFRTMVTVFSWLWTMEYTPFDFTRLLGPFGPYITAWAFKRRIARSAEGSYMRKLSHQQVSALDTYSYQNHAAPASGERILNSILMPGAYARCPLILWLRGGEDVGCITCPVTLVYGSRGVDWMESKFGFELCGNLRREGIDAVCVEMGNQVGHLNYLEDPAQFESIVADQVLLQRRLVR